MLASRRGFVMPLVLLLSVVVSLMLAMAVERNVAKALNVRRQVRAYREHHAAKGLQEAISAWLNTQNSRGVTEVLGTGGHVFDLNMPDRTVVKVYLSDGQGTILDPTAAASGDHEDALAIYQRLRLLCQDLKRPWEGMVRPLGPFQVSVNSADPLVLQAIAEQYLGVDDGAVLVARILEARADKGGLERTDLLAFATELDLDNDVRNTLINLLTTTPELWFVTIELYTDGARGSRLAARYGGLVPLRSSARTNNGGAWEQPGVFLTWEELGVEYDPNRDDGDDRR
jgi:hypothetical protein